MLQLGDASVVGRYQIAVAVVDCKAEVAKENGSGGKEAWQGSEGQEGKMREQEKRGGLTKRVLCLLVQWFLDAKRK